jgi:hypothetical protein
MDDFEVHGADQFLRLSKALKEAGQTGLRKELNKGLREATKPLIAQTRVAASRLPQRGGLAARVAKTPQRVQVRTGRDPGVRIVVPKSSSGARAADAGQVRHPVFGNRKVWVTQKVTGGWFSDTLRDGASVVRPKLRDALEAIADRVVKEAK